MTTKVLYVTAHLPDHNALEAGHKTAASNLSKLVNDNNVDCFLISRRRYTENDLTINGVSDFYCCVITRANYFLAILAILAGIPPRFTTRLSLSAVFKLGKLIKKNNYDIIYFEFSQVFPYIILNCTTTNIVLSIHDLQSDVVNRKPFYERIFYRLTFAYERKIFQNVDQIQVQSQTDRQKLVSLYGINPSNIILIKPVLSGFLKGFERFPAEIVPNTILFWGAMNRIENNSAIIYFINKVFPIIKSLHPTSILYVIGSSPSEELLRYSSSSIVITGYVHDPSRYFKQASIGIAPLTQGAGIKVKVLEMLEAGLNVVSTEVGAEGIEKNPLLHVVELQDFPFVISKVWERINVS